MKKKENKSNDENIYDINGEIIKHGDVLKIIKMREKISYHKENKFYLVDCETFGIPCLISNKTGTAHPIFNMDADFEIKKTK